MIRYTHTDVHRRLLDVALSDEYHRSDYIEDQALHCPYYVPLEGKLGADWGIVVNPESARFGMLTFEHDDCGCPEPEDGNRHDGCPDQQGDMWDAEWRHVCDDLCDTPCDEAKDGAS